MTASKNEYSELHSFHEEKNEEILHLVEMINLSEISSIKTTLSSIVRVINSPKATVKELIEVIQLDPPLAARVLKTANSAYFSRSFTKTFSDLEQAVIWMGLEVIRELALNQKVCEIFDKDEKIEDYSRRQLWRHSVAVATMARMVYRKEFGKGGENVYLAGLLHDIGIIAEDQFVADSFKEALIMARDAQISLSEAENEILGYNHAMVGRAISYSWGLPAALQCSIGRHSHPNDFNGPHAVMIATLFAVDYYCQQNGFTYGAPPMAADDHFNKAMDRMNVKEMAFQMIFNEMKEEMTIMTEKGLI